MILFILSKPFFSIQEDRVIDQPGRADPDREQGDGTPIGDQGR
jgi:hypothetical protein